MRNVYCRVNELVTDSSPFIRLFMLCAASLFTIAAPVSPFVFGEAAKKLMAMTGKIDIQQIICDSGCTKKRNHHHMQQSNSWIV